MTAWSDSSLERLSRRGLLAGALAAVADRATAADRPFGARLVAAAQAQVGVTTVYDPAYVRLAYPGGDLPRQRGVCTDVVIRAYRDAFGVDLQRLVHEDMLAHRSSYPRRWGAGGVDANIDHRRVPNLQVFFQRQKAAIAGARNAAAYRPGDLVTVTLPGGLPHIMVVATPPHVIHNIGAGAQTEDRLFAFVQTGHYRYVPQGVAT